MQYIPEMPDLLEAVQDFLMKDIMPRVKSDDFTAYKALVSWNMLGIMARELRGGEPLLNEEIAGLKRLLGSDAAEPRSYSEKLALARDLNRELARKIRADKQAGPESEIWQHVKGTLADNLKAVNPRFGG